MIFLSEKQQQRKDFGVATPSSSVFVILVKVDAKTLSHFSQSDATFTLNLANQMHFEQQ